MGEYGEVGSLPSAEPNVIRIAGKLFVAYTFFKLGMKHSVVLYSLEDKKDLLQLAGASMLVHHKDSDD